MYFLPQQPLGDFKLKIFGAFNDTIKQINETNEYLTIQLQLVQLPIQNSTEKVKVGSKKNPVWDKTETETELFLFDRIF